MPNVALANRFLAILASTPLPPIPALFTVATGLSSVFLLSLSLRTLPLGTAYAVWTGIGAASTAIPGTTMLGDSAAQLRMLCIALILTGVTGLKLVSGN